MECVGAIEAKDRFTELVGKVEHGETITITRDGVPVALLSPPPKDARHPTKADRMSVQEAIHSIRERRRGIRLDGLSIREMRDEGRA